MCHQIRAIVTISVTVYHVDENVLLLTAGECRPVTHYEVMNHTLPCRLVRKNRNCFFS